MVEEQPSSAVRTGVLVAANYGVLVDGVFSSAPQLARSWLLLNDLPTLREVFRRRGVSHGRSEDDVRYLDEYKVFREQVADHQRSDMILRYAMSHSATKPIIRIRGGERGLVRGEVKSVSPKGSSRYTASLQLGRDTFLGYAPGCQCKYGEEADLRLAHRIAENAKIDDYLCLHSGALALHRGENQVFSVTGKRPDALLGLLENYYGPQGDHFRSAARLHGERSVYTDRFLDEFERHASPGEVQWVVVGLREERKDEDGLSGFARERIADRVRLRNHFIQYYGDKGFVEDGYAREGWLPHEGGFVALRQTQGDDRAVNICLHDSFPPFAVERSLEGFSRKLNVWYPSAKELFGRAGTRDAPQSSFTTIDDVTRRYAATRVIIPDREVYKDTVFAGMYERLTA